MHQVPSDPKSVVILADFDSLSPDVIFDHLTRPELLVKWWPTEAQSDPRVGGRYIYSWPTQKWTLTGEFKSFVPSKHLAFTWCWNHEPGGTREQMVEIYMEPYLGTGTRLGIHQHDFELGDEGQADRQGVAEGWIHFMMRLAGLSIGNAN